MLLGAIYLFQVYPLFSAPFLWQHAADIQKGDYSWPGRWKINSDRGGISWWSDFKGKILCRGRGKEATLVWRKKREAVPVGIKHWKDNLRPQGWHQQLRLVHWQLCLCCSFISPQPLVDLHPGTQRAPGPSPVPSPGRAKKAVKEMMEVCKKSLLGKLSSLSLLPAQPVDVELTEFPMVLRPLCKVSLTLPQSVVGHRFSNFYRIIHHNYYYCYILLLKFRHMVFLRHMTELRADPPTFVSIIGKGLTDSFHPFWIAIMWKFLS